MVSQHGGFVLDEGVDPQFEMQDGTIMQATAQEAPQVLKAGGRLLPTQSLKMYDPTGLRRSVPLGNISAASQAGFQVAPRVQASADAGAPLPSETQPQRGLEGKTWKTAFQEVMEKPLSHLPFLNMVDMLDSAMIYQIVKRQDRGEKLTPMEQQKLDTWQAEQTREQSWGYKALSTALKMPAYMYEFVAAGGAIKAGSRAVLNKSVGKMVVSNVDELSTVAANKAVIEASKRLGASLPGMEAHIAEQIAKSGPGVKIAMDDTSAPGLLAGKTSRNMWPKARWVRPYILRNSLPRSAGSTPRRTFLPQAQGPPPRSPSGSSATTSLS